MNALNVRRTREGGCRAADPRVLYVSRLLRLSKGTAGLHCTCAAVCVNSNPPVFQTAECDSAAVRGKQDTSTLRTLPQPSYIPNTLASCTPTPCHALATSPQVHIKRPSASSFKPETRVVLSPEREGCKPHPNESHVRWPQAHLVVLHVGSRPLLHLHDSPIWWHLCT